MVEHLKRQEKKLQRTIKINRTILSVVVDASHRYHLLFLFWTLSETLFTVVCHVQLTSNFNTSAIKTIAEPQNSGELHGPRKGRSAKSQGKNKGRPSIKVTSPPHLESAEDKNEVWTLYGLFQLSNHVVCNSTQSHSLNLCGLTCDSEYIYSLLLTDTLN